MDLGRLLCLQAVTPALDLRAATPVNKDRRGCYSDRFEVERIYFMNINVWREQVSEHMGQPVNLNSRKKWP